MGRFHENHITQVRYQPQAQAHTTNTNTAAAGRDTTTDDTREPQNECEALLLGGSRARGSEAFVGKMAGRRDYRGRRTRVRNAKGKGLCAQVNATKYKIANWQLRAINTNHFTNTRISELGKKKTRFYRVATAMTHFCQRYPKTYHFEVHLC